MKLCAAVLPWLLLLFSTEGFCEQRVHCQWGPFGAWSQCDGCTKLQTRSRAMVVFSQFGGYSCGGGWTETRSCDTTRSCPLDDGCGGWFRCQSGKCISQSLVCNGDQDCEEDAQDERVCDVTKHSVCIYSVPPPNIELIGLGFDVVLGTRRGSVINTKSFGGQCRTIFSGLHKAIYRLPLSITQLNFVVTVQNDFSDEMFTSKWHYTKDKVNRETVIGTTTGSKSYDYHFSDEKSQTQKVLILKNDIEVAQFQSNSPQNLPISEQFWKALNKLPSVYDYSAYRRVLERFGTHYLSEGTLGGSFKAAATVDEETQKWMESMSQEQNECVTKKRWALFGLIPIIRVRCSSSADDQSHNLELPRSLIQEQQVTVKGGESSSATALTVMQPSDLARNWEKYTNWADSVKSFPVVTKQKLRPLSELVKEVHCAGVKKLYLRRAIEQYISEKDACRCRPCRNNGIPIKDGDACTCICKPNTSGQACERGTEVEGQPGVIDGRWSCWSAWSQCSGAQRSRSRSCSNPSPQNGGQACIGDTTERSICEDLEYLKTMEPQCFDSTLQAPPMCKTPPALINGYILDPKDSYYVGSRVQYTCTGGFYLVGHTIIECTADQTWSATPGLCTKSRCTLAALADGVVASPIRQAYGIGESVSLSCSDNRTLQGEATVICDPSLHFSPNPADVQCSPVIIPQLGADSVHCKLWEKPLAGKCVCKMPFECSSSFTFCATATSGGRRSVLLNACKIHALQCMGKSYVIAEDSSCQWPHRDTAGCVGCHMWENCDDQTNNCRCKDSADCLSSGLDVCVRVGEDETAANQTMSECEAGHRQCKGEKVTVVSVQPCAS